jgi:CDP-glucose 4,6-dehydratase
VTSDKCYENRESGHAYREDDPMGGHDVYSMSKGATELLVASWRRSFFPPAELRAHGVAVATARAGNVIGGGDWAVDRMVPDAIRALAAGTAVTMRNPEAVRPWQHVLDPLAGYLLLAAGLRGPHAAELCEAFNFGPAPGGERSVSELVDALLAAWGSGHAERGSSPDDRHEAGLLHLAIDKAVTRLDWTPRWYRAHLDDPKGPAARRVCQEQIASHMGADGPGR